MGNRVYCPHCGRSFKMRSPEKVKKVKKKKKKKKKERAPMTKHAPLPWRKKVASEGKKDTSSDEGIRRKFDDVKYLLE